MNENEWLNKAQAEEYIEAADCYLAQYIMGMESTPSDELEVLIALASAGIRQGNVCLPLRDNALLDDLGLAPDLDAIAAAGVVGTPGDPEAPLVLDGDRLYLARYHAWEQQVIQALDQRLAQPVADLDRQRLKQGLADLFGKGGETDWQRAAAAMALLKRFCIISGGPGTGKTWTVARILKLLLDQPGGDALRIALAAPTGKAAARMTESIGQAGLALPDKVKQAQTLHRLLGMRQGRVQPKHHAGNPLDVDLLILDEMSMVDLPMMARLLAALPQQARLILLGDRHQLASVEAGQIMADLCGRAELTWSADLAEDIRSLSGDQLPLGHDLPAMADHLVELQQSRRFDKHPDIGALAEAVNQGTLDAALAVLGRESDEIQHYPSDRDTLKNRVHEQLLPLFQSIRAATTPAEALQKLEQLRVLCAVRNGPQGVRHVNSLVERALGVEGQGLYHGQPVMVTVNDYGQKLFNGDIGLVLNNSDGRLRVFFPEGENQVREILPARLPAHETVYAMTIHKSQGSEFDRVILVLPDDDSPVVTRELLYTGITRARSQVMLCASEASLGRAIARQVQRVSGLRDALWGTA